MQQIADWPKMLDGRLLPCFEAYWTTSLTSLARQMGAERPAAVMGAPLEQIVSDDAGARHARL